MSWPLHPLGAVTKKIGSGSTPRGGDSAYKTNGIPLIRSMNVHDGEFRPQGLAFIDNEQAKLLKNVTLESADVLINITGASVARCCILPENYAGGRVNQHVAIIRPKPELDSKFLSYFLTASQTKRRLLSTAGGGATREALTKAQLEELQIPLPPLNEQKRIAAILDKADALRAKRRQAIALLDSLTQSIFLEMFGEDGDGVSIGELISQKRLLLHKDGNHGSNYPRADEFSNEGVPFLSARSIADDGTVIAEQIQYLNFEKAAKLKIGWIEAGDVLLSHNASVGKVGLYRGEFGPALIGTSLTAFRANPDEIASEFLYAALRGNYFQRQLLKTMGQTTRNQVPITAQKHLKLRIPSIRKQHIFMSQLNVHSLQYSKAIGTIKLLDSLFASLQHRAFTGQL